jgi:5,10-methylenetetrahydrofolate reductase
MALYKSLLGIHNAYAIGSPATAMMFEFGPPKADKGSLRRLRIDLGADGRMSGAEVRSVIGMTVQVARTGLTEPFDTPHVQLLDSSDEIQDLVQTYLPAQDVRSLVQEVRTRFGC